MSAHGKVSRETKLTPFQRLRKTYKLRITDIAKLAEVTWPTAQSWDKAKTSPGSSDALRLIDNLKKVKGVTVELSDLVARA